ncbi:hypothetical protein [Sporolactobacillus nakayamae]|uniref:Uncharacterized protein n=1 Tax=Sporolactobacillus nakayamae TaxID=269670 RepID=A0A1I2P3K1_9BACL|nr:hypothetical protein [Sporolactobacillus nakayamae]SFG08527.1 hypothetical protein SAMN02982927_00611 [Sporolactobacillus nakayamae]
MSFVWIIGLVIWMIFYVAKSVEKQNAQEQKRRQELGRRTNTRPQMPSAKRQITQANRDVNRRAEPIMEQAPTDTHTAENVWMKKYYETKDRMNQSSSQRTVDRSLHPAKASGSENVGNGWKSNQDALRQAFIFSECIGKPRAVQPHHFFDRNRVR